MWERLKEKLTSRKFIAMLIMLLWYVIGGAINGWWEELGWQIVAIVLGYIGVEGAVDIARWLRGKE